MLVTGVEDPDTRAHGANEGLHLAEFERVVLAEALLLAKLGGPSVVEEAPPAPFETSGVSRRAWRPSSTTGCGESVRRAPARRLAHVCGVFGVWAPGEDIAKLTYFGLYALQHRGQESAGIAVSNGRQILVYKDMGLVSQAFDESTLDALKGHVAVGHCRYSTTGASTWHNAQPTFRPTADGSIALGHNGNLINTHELLEAVAALPSDPGELDLHARELEASSTNDSGLLTALLAHHPDTSLEQRALDVLPTLRGAFSLVWINEDALYAARDPQGIRPLVLGRLDRGWVVASESAALATIGASVVREVEPGEMLVIDESGLRSHMFADAGAEGLRVRVRLPRPPRRHHQRPQRPRGAGRDGPPAGPRVSPSRPTW